MLRLPEAVLLDMDGTLVDSHQAVEAAWTAWALDHGLEPGSVLAVCHGNQVTTTVGRFLPQLSPAELQAQARHHLERECTDLQEVRAAAGAVELIAWLEAHHVPWAVVTNSHARLAAARLGASGITPPLVLTLDDVANGKPAPDGFLQAAARLGVAPENCLAVEDSPAGLQAARAAGMTRAAVGGAQDAEVVCARLEDLLRQLSRRWAGSSPSGPPTGRTARR